MIPKRIERMATLALFGEIVLHAFWPIGAHYGASLMPQIRFLAFTTLLSSLLFGASMFWRGKWPELKKREYWKPLLTYTILIAVIPYGLITYATRYSSGLNTTIFTQSEMIYAAILGAWLLKERFNRWRILGIAAIAMANLALLLDNELNFHWAELVLVSAPLLFSYANVLAKRLIHAVDWSTLLFFRSMVAGVILLAISIGIEGPGLPPQELWFFLLWFSIFTFGLAKIFWQLALKHLDLSKMSALATTYPALSFVFAYFWLGEIPNQSQWVGIVFTFLGIAFLMKSPSKQYEDDF